MKALAMNWRMKKKWRRLRGIAFGFALLAVVPLTSNIAWANPSKTLQQKLQRKVAVTWQGQQLAVALGRLTNAGDIPLWLDRRVDRRQTVTMQFADLPLAQALEKIAERQSLGFVQLESIVYLGPQQTALELPTLISQARNQLTQMPAKQKRRWLRKDKTAWPSLSEPRTLAESWLHKAGLQLQGSKKISHDLWPEQSLPPLALVDRLVLLLAGFDLTCKIAPDGVGCEIVPINRPLKLLPQRRHPRGKPPKAQAGPSSRQLFTLRLENQPLGKVLDQLARQLQLQVVWETEKREARSQHISCDVQNADLDALLQSVLTPAGLQHQRQGKQITIQAKQ